MCGIKTNLFLLFPVLQICFVLKASHLEKVLLILALREIKFTDPLRKHFKLKFPLQTGLVRGQEAVCLCTVISTIPTWLLAVHVKVSE